MYCQNRKLYGFAVPVTLLSVTATSVGPPSVPEVTEIRANGGRIWDRRTVEKDLLLRWGVRRIGRTAAMPALARVRHGVGVDVLPRQSQLVAKLDVDRYLAR